MLQDGTIYKFRVAAVNSEGTGAYSEDATLNFMGWNVKEKSDDGTVAVIIVVVIVILLLALGAFITWFLCTNQKRAEQERSEEVV